jgi:hypothetical protein
MLIPSGFGSHLHEDGLDFVHARGNRAGRLCRSFSVSSAASQPNLKLVGLDPGDRWSREQQAKLAVIKENRLAAHASGLDPSDPRWILAMQTQARLQGATLGPERRDELMRSSRKLGLRPFEANLVIAIVQDRARTGQNAETVTPTLRLLSEASPEPSPQAESNWPRWLMAIAAAVAVAGLLLRWLATI